MPDPLSLGLGIVSGLTSLGGLIGGSAAAARAQAAKEAAIRDMSAQLDQDYNDLVANNRRGLYAAAGTGGDAIAQLGRHLGSSLAGAGVYNSSATAGALAQAQNDQNAALARLSADNTYNEKSLLNQNRRYLTGLKLNLANQNYDYARNDLADSRSGLASFLGSLAQTNIAKSGQNQLQNSLTRAAGGYGNPSVLNLGAGMGGPINIHSMFPGTGAFNPNVFDNSAPTGTAAILKKYGIVPIAPMPGYP